MLVITMRFSFSSSTITIVPLILNFLGSTAIPVKPVVLSSAVSPVAFRVTFVRSVIASSPNIIFSKSFAFEGTTNSTLKSPSSAVVAQSPARPITL